MKKQLTILDIAKELASRGHKVTYRQRSDGGVIITSIDGVKYSRAGTGNAVARQIVGADVSQARKVQLQRITKGSPKSRKEMAEKSKEGVDERVAQELNKLAKKVNRETRKNEKEKGKAGYVSIRTIRYWLKSEGREEIERRLNERMKYAKGLAYSKNVNYLLQRLAELEQLRDDIKDIKKVYDCILELAPKIREADIYPIYQAIYKLSNGQITADQLIAYIKAQLKE